MASRRTIGPIGGAAVLLSIATLAAFEGPAGGAGPATPSGADRRPNVIVVMTDDQTVDDLRVMPQTRALLGAGGVTFDRSFVSYPVCCPSRATFLSGQYAHNHRVLGLYPPTGGYGRFDASNSLPVWLRRAGYHTAHLGKYMNGYGTDTAATVPPGWSEWYGAVGYSTYRMWGYKLNENGRTRTYGRSLNRDPRDYQTDVLTRRALRVVKDQRTRSRPLFMSIAYLAPHHEAPRVRRASGELVRAAPRHAGALTHEQLARTPAFNEADVSDKPPFIRRRPPLGSAQVARIVRHYRERQESLLAVDDGVARIVATLKRTGQLKRTYILFTSDNGYMQGEHRVPSGKMLPYDPSTRVPLLLRGPELPAGAHSHALVGNVDLAPTILALAHAQPGKPQDGTSLLPLARHPRRTTRRPLLHETGGRSFTAPRDQDPAAISATRPVLSYRAIRTNRWLYVRYRNGTRELYDLKRDPHELRSRHADPRYRGTRLALQRALLQLGRCKGAKCRTPIPPIPPPAARRGGARTAASAATTCLIDAVTAWSERSLFTPLWRLRAQPARLACGA